MNSLDALNQRIIKRWMNANDGTRSSLFPSVFHNLNLECNVLFVGLNPSAPKHQKDTVAGSDEDVQTLKERIIAREQRQIHGEGAKKKGQYKRYFGIINRLEKSCDISWDHIDLFHFRHTIQGEVLKKVESESSDYEFEMEIFESVLKLFKTKVVFVNNRMASNYIQQHFGNLLTYDGDNNWSVFKSGDHAKVFIFEGMLSRIQKLTYDQRVEQQKHRLLNALEW
jgi:hypothetical protein